MPGVTTHGKHGFGDAGTRLDLRHLRAEAGQVPGSPSSVTLPRLPLCRHLFLGWAPLWCGLFRSSRGHFQGPGPRVSWAALPGQLKGDVTSVGQQRRPGSCTFPTQAWPTGDRD